MAMSFEDVTNIKSRDVYFSYTIQEGDYYGRNDKFKKIAA